MSMKKIGLILGIALLGVLEMNAQQEPIFSNYIWNPLSFNPGVAGTKSYMTMNAVVREQWVGFDGRPRTQSFNMHTALRNNQLGIGASIINDKLGPINSLTLQGNFSYKIKVDRTTYVSLGIKSEVSLWQGKFVDLDLADDPSLANNVRSAFLPNFGTGAYLKAKKYFFGIAAPRVLNNEFNDGLDWDQGRQVAHFYAHGGYTHALDRDIMFKPSFMLNYVKNVKPELTISANMEFNRQLWAGISYRTASAISPLIAYKFTNQIKAGYSYELSLNKLVNHNSGTHELMVSYDFFYPTGRVVSPIFF